MFVKDLQVLVYSLLMLQLAWHLLKGTATVNELIVIFLIYCHLSDLVSLGVFDTPQRFAHGDLHALLQYLLLGKLKNYCSAKLR